MKLVSMIPIDYIHNRNLVQLNKLSKLIYPCEHELKKKVFFFQDTGWIPLRLQETMTPNRRKPCRIGEISKINFFFIMLRKNFHYKKIELQIRSLWKRPTCVSRNDGNIPPWLNDWVFRVSFQMRNVLKQRQTKSLSHGSPQNIFDRTSCFPGEFPLLMVKLWWLFYPSYFCLNKDMQCLNNQAHNELKLLIYILFCGNGCFTMYYCNIIF